MDEALDEAIAQADALAYLVYGDESWLVDRAVQALETAVLPRIGPPGFNLAAFRAGDDGVEEALGVARTLPMMADRRLVVIRDLHLGRDAFYEALDDYLQHASDTTVLILAGSGFPKVRKGGRNWSSRIQNLVKKVGVVVRYRSRDSDPVGFARDHAARLGHDLAPDAARLLVDLAGRELSRVAREVEKAALYVDADAEIRVDDVAEACSSLAEQEVWDLTNGIAARDADQALGALHRLLDEGTNPRQLLGMVLWQLRLVLRVAEARRRGASDSEILGSVRMRRDVFRRLSMALAQHPPAAADTLERVARANRDMNSVRAGDRRVLEALVVELTTVAA